MPLVNVQVNGRPYTVSCDEGEENHLRELGQYLDKRVRELSGSVGQVGDLRLLLMAGLMVADELVEALAKLEEREREIAALRAVTPMTSQKLQEREDRMAEVLETAASKIEAISARFAPA